MKHRITVVLATALLTTLSLANHAEVEQANRKKPNIIIIYADDLGLADIGKCPHGDDAKIPTPNCNRLIEAGAMFTDAHSASAVCTPSRYALLTGRYSWRTWLKCWVVQEHMPLLIEPDRYTFGKMLQNSGYHTGVVGKWHLGWGDKIGDYRRGKLSPGPWECGFDSSFVVPFSHNSTQPMQVFVKDRQIIGIKPGEDINDKNVLKRAVRSLEDTATELSKAAVDFIKQNKNRPFFLYYPTTNVHFPVTPHKQFIGKSKRGKYGDFVVEFDWAVGEITKTLDELGLTENTILMVTSDNGSIVAASNPYYRGKKCSIYEGGHRVPLIVSWPAVIRQNLVIDEPVCQTDLMPTVADILGVTLPEGAAQDGVSILPLLKGETMTAPRRPIVHHDLIGSFAIRSGKWKLIDGAGEFSGLDWGGMAQSGEGKPVKLEDGRFEDVNFGLDVSSVVAARGKGELYDLENDPRETNNLWDKHPEVVKELVECLNKERKKSF